MTEDGGVRPAAYALSARVGQNLGQTSSGLKACAALLSTGSDSNRPGQDKVLPNCSNYHFRSAKTTEGKLYPRSRLQTIILFIA